MRKSGIATVGDIPWGTHFCHFYTNKTDLLDVLVPYFKTGLEQNEFCVWGTFDPLNQQEAESALEHALPGAHTRLAAGDIEIVQQSQWYRGDGALNLPQLVHHWEAKLARALERGSAGMRVNVNGEWLAQRDQQNLDGYEDEFSRLIAQRPIIMLCAYPLAVDRDAEILDAGYTHRFAIARRDGDWQVVETPELRQARANVERLNAELGRRAGERIQELREADINKQQETAARLRAEKALRASRERSQCYFELGLVGMAIVSPTEGCIEVNGRLCDILGYERGELMQTKWAALTHPDDLAGDIRNYERVLAGEVNGYQAAKRWVRKNGDVVHTNTSLRCQRHADGSVDYFAAMVEEVAVPGPFPVGDRPAVGKSRPGPQVLSGREREVVRLMGLGRTVKDVAAMLELSEKTVSTYRSRILTKLALKSTAELIRYALTNRLAE